MAKIKIIHIVPTFAVGGVQTGILYTLEELNQTYDFKILVIGKIDEEWLSTLSGDVRKNIIGSGKENLISGWFRSYQILKEINPDVIISSLWKSVPLSLIYKSINPKVLLCGFFHYAGTTHLIDRFFTNMLARFNQLSFADSSATLQYIRNTWSIKEGVVIPYIFSLNVSRVIRTVSPKKIKIAYFGRIAKQKRIDRSIEFCKICKINNLHFTFDVYGIGSTEKFKKMIEDFDLQQEVVFKNAIPSNLVVTYLKNYDFLLQLSDNEGMSTSVVEAMSCGIVPIVTPVGEIAEYSKDGFNAIWLKQNFDENLNDLFNKFNAVVNSPHLYEQLSIHAYNTFKGKLNYTESLTKAINDHFKNE